MNEKKTEKMPCINPRVRNLTKSQNPLCIFAKGVSLYRPIIAVVIGLNVYLNGYIKHTLDNAKYI